ncbi:MAG: hypothetical protein WC756_15940 [Taibaiella sp.]|jgi:hypothetical protein
MINLYTIIKAKRKGKIPFLLLCVLGLMLGNKVEAQRVYANTEQHSATQSILVVTLSEVTNPTNAVDTPNFSNFSTLFTTLGALSLIEAWQNLQFPSTPLISSPIIIKYGGSASLISLLAGTSIQPTLSGSLVGSPYTQSTFLGLLNAGATDAEIILPAPNISYNGIRLKVSSTLLGAALTAKYYYAFYIAAPLVSNQTICSNTTATLTITNAQAGYTYKWYNATMDTLLQSSTAISFTTPALSAAKTYNVVAYESSSGTAFYSGNTPVTVNINPLPTITTATPIYICHGLSVFPLSYGSPANNPNMYSITWSNAATLAGFSAVAYTTLTSSPLNIPKPIAAPIATYQGSFLIKNSNNCVNTYPFSLIVQSPPDPHATTTFQ